MRRILIGTIVFASSMAYAENHKSNLDKLSMKGEFQWRTESAVNRRGVQGARQSEQSLSRLRTF
jgi:hypothetical protein